MAKSKKYDYFEITATVEMNYRINTNEKMTKADFEKAIRNSSNIFDSDVVADAGHEELVGLISLDSVEPIKTDD